MEAFIAGFTARRQADPRVPGVRASRRAKLRDFARHIAVRRHAGPRQRVPARRRASSPTTCASAPAPALPRRSTARARRGRPFVYFPLHVIDDYKIKRVIPHCVDQASLIEQVADALPQGHDLVLKEHPMSIGRNRLALLRRLDATSRTSRLVEPHTSSHELIRALARGRRDLLDGRPGGAAARQAGADARPAVLLRLRRDGGRRLVPRDPHGRCRRCCDFRPDRERILRFLHAAMRACSPGQAGARRRLRRERPALAAPGRRARGDGAARGRAERRARVRAG